MNNTPIFMKIIKNFIKNEKKILIFFSMPFKIV